MKEEYFETEDDFHYEGPPIKRKKENVIKHTCSKVKIAEKYWSIELKKKEKCPICGYGIDE